MANSSVVISRDSNFFGAASDVFVELAYLSDDANGSVPNAEIIGLRDFMLIEYVWAPGAATPANSFKLRAEDAVGDLLYLSGDVAADLFARKMASEYTGNFPRVDGKITIKLVEVTLGINACNIGNAKAGTLKLRFAKR